MPDIAITADQRERLRWIQRRLGEDVEYGHVRPSDALDYLLDHAETTGGLSDISPDGPNTSSPDGADSRAAPDGNPASDDAEEAARSDGQADAPVDDEAGVGPPTLHTSPSANVVRIGNPAAAHSGTDADGSTTTDTEESDPVDADGDGDGGASGAGGDGGGDEDGDGETGRDGDGGEADATDADDGVADAVPTLNSTMSLLETHDDKWREAESGEAKYAVDLPNGSTEHARTKDDVRAVLFKQYR